MNVRAALSLAAMASLCGCGGASGGSGGGAGGQGSTGGGAAAGGSVDYNAPANLDACKLLTPTDAASILQGNVVPGSATHTMCAYGGDNGERLGVELGGAALFDPGRKASKASGSEVDDVSGLGDAAYFQVSGGSAQLFVKKAGAAMTVTFTTTGSGGVEREKTVEKQVAQQAVSRM